jgi:predicted MFS family arabinose efflux permease
MNVGPAVGVSVATPPSPWRTRDFRLVWTGGFINDIGDWLLLVALPVYVFIKSGSGTDTAILFVVELVAALLLGPVGGSLVDRWDLRRTLIATNVAQAITLIPLLAVTGTRIWPAYLVVGAQAILTQINNPASVALLPRVVTPDQLTVANAANSTSASLARLIGAPLGGLAVGLGGIGAVVVIDAATFLAVAIATAFVRTNTTAITTDKDTGDVVASGVRAGARAILAQRRLRALLLIDALGQVAQGFFLVLFVVFIVRQLNGGGVDVGIIRGSMAVGGILGATVIGKSAQRWSPAQLLTFGYLGMGIVSIVFWNAPSVTTQVWVYLILFGLSGLPGAALGIGTFSAVQKLSPTGMLGRVVGMAGALDALARACGSLVAGLLISRTKLVVLLDVQSSIYLACGALAFVFLMRRDQGFQRTDDDRCSTITR